MVFLVYFRYRLVPIEKYHLMLVISLFFYGYSDVSNECIFALLYMKNVLNLY
jgi:hypothetical protein